MKRTTKEWSERGLVAFRIPDLARKVRRRQALVLAYHNVVPDDCPPVGDRSLHLRLCDFRAQLDVLQATHDVVPLETLLEDPEESARPRAILTFDDAYRGALELAIPEIVDRGLPVTVFVSPGLLGSDAFWWDALAVGNGARLAPELRRRALAEMGGRQDRIFSWARNRGLHPDADLHWLARPASAEEVRVAAELRGVRFGSHSWSHPDLTSLERDTFGRELAEATRWLASNVRDPSSWFAYPYGIHDPDARARIAAAGHEGGVSGDAGWTHLPPEEPFAVRRFNVPAGLSEAGFRLRTAGVPLP